MHDHIIENLRNRFLSGNYARETLLEELFGHEEIKAMHPSEIRRATVIGSIANEVLNGHHDYDPCKILAIGDIKYFGNLHNSWNNIVQANLRSIEPSELSGYDLSGLGSSKLRECIREYMSHYYNTTLLDADLANEIVPSYGGTDSFVTILNVIRNQYPGKNIRFIYPEASFLANVKIAETILGNSSLRPIPKPNKTNFFFSGEQIDEFYAKPRNSEDVNIFYITPVGNPTGNKIRGMSEVLEQIHTHDPEALCIIDSVYVGLLPNTESQSLFRKIFQNHDLMKQLIFTESLSKTLGMTGIRIGWTWTLHPKLGTEIKKYTTLTKAGFSKLLDSFGTRLLSEPSLFDFQEQVYAFWSRERILFLEHAKKEFGDLFDFESSPEIADREGIYVLLKIRENLTKEYIFAKTGIIGVGIELSDGDYIRYAFGNMNEFSSKEI